MASSVIHMAIANELNKELKRNNDRLLIGTIAPDISKEIGETRVKSHFLDEKGSNVPNVDDFVMGYFIHIYVDYLWFKYFVPEIHDNNYITKLDGTRVKCTDEVARDYIYNDYTNLNTILLDIYNMDLDIFYNEPPEFENIIEEIPMDKLYLIINKCSVIIENSKENKSYLFDINAVKRFIETSIDLTRSKLGELDLL